ncbi:VWA domain-containing protein [Bifidobacterium indicum]|uniref:VWA domain-containing protein n=1 Tax=Bifidobacterium indicum TaxID=1691 RepID=UPI0026233C0B|nr:VWA domain-containing protein [uncultured Bifidobacterium sp.]
MNIGRVTWRWPWIMALGLVLAIGVVLAVLWMEARRNRARQSGQDERSRIEVWSLDEDLNTEAGIRLFHQWRNLGRLACLLLVLTLLAGICLAGRPSTVDTTEETGHSRDIVLCLDVSGSTLPYDREVLVSYLDLVGRFKGERIALSIFNSTSRTVFPLTDDYDMVTKELRRANRILKGVQSQDQIDKMSDKQYQDISDWLEGTQNRKDVTSLIGDGLVGCAALLPGFTTKESGRGEEAEDRAASVVLATDNVTSGKPTYTLEEALKLTARTGIAVDGLYSGPKESLSDESTQEMRRLIESHQGIFLVQQNGDSIASLVRQIERRHGGDPGTVRQSSLVDSPGWWVLAMSLALGGYLILVWRLKR